MRRVQICENVVQEFQKLERGELIECDLKCRAGNTPSKDVRMSVLEKHIVGNDVARTVPPLPLRKSSSRTNVNFFRKGGLLKLSTIVDVSSTCAIFQYSPDHVPSLSLRVFFFRWKQWAAKMGKSVSTFFWNRSEDRKCGFSSHVQDAVFVQSNYTWKSSLSWVIGGWKLL